MNTSMPGQEGIPSVFSPMARTLEDLVYFSKSLIGVKPWLWDHSVHPIEWRAEEERKVRETEKFKIGVMRTDGEIDEPRDLSIYRSHQLNHFKESSTHHQLVPVHSNVPYPPSHPRVTPSSTCPRPPLTTLSSSRRNSSTRTAAKRSSPTSVPARPTTPARVKCRST